MSVDVKLVKSLLERAKSEGVEKIVVGAVVSYDNKVLCLKRRKGDFMAGLWELPSGTLEDGETIEQCLYRETKEETGLRIEEVLDYVGSFDYSSGSGKKARQFTFKVSSLSSVVKLDPNEHEEYVWLKESELDNYNISEETKTQIRSIWHVKK